MVRVSDFTFTSNRKHLIFIFFIFAELQVFHFFFVFSQHKRHDHELNRSFFIIIILVEITPEAGAVKCQVTTDNFTD